MLKPDAVKETISRALDAGTVAYVGKASDGRYEPFVFRRALNANDVEIADDVYLIAQERAEEYMAKMAAAASTLTGPTAPVVGPVVTTGGGAPTPPSAAKKPMPGTESEPLQGREIAGFGWSGEISPQRWMNFYTKVLSRFATAGGLKLTVTIDVEPPGGLSMSKVEETKVALRELGLPEGVNLKPPGGRS